jgi:hypothetical protein
MEGHEIRSKKGFFVIFDLRCFVVKFYSTANT